MSGISAPVTPDRITPRKRVRRWRPSLVTFSFVWLLAIAVMTVLGSALAPHAPGQQDLLTGLAGPVSGHPLGTDELGRDILSRMIAGTRGPVLGGVAVALGAGLISVTLGLLAGYLNGKTDALIMRVIDLMLALPGLLVIIVVIGAFNGGFVVAVVLLAVLTAPGDARIIRGVALEQRPRAYVEAARVLGLSSPKIMASHILPNILPLVVVNLCLDFTGGMIALAGLSFLGISTNPGAADWGRMLFENQGLLTVNPWAALGPAVMIMLTAAAANIAGDWLYERIDARGRAR